jgi:cell division GTPase FtsZ
VANLIKKTASPRAKIIFGVSEDKTIEKGEIKVTLIATGIE